MLAVALAVDVAERQHMRHIVEPAPCNFLGHRDLVFVVGNLADGIKTRPRAWGTHHRREHRPDRR
jgi:hypothetical protein